MKIAAIICEYNPFHNGHKYQIDMLKKEYDAVISIMSGSFVQRGEPAVIDKWGRTETALLNGIDLVIELPVCYAVNTAEKFAFGGVMIAAATGVTDALCFGSESGDISEFLNAAALLNNEPEKVSNKIKECMSSGNSYPAARQKAYKGLIDESLLSEPNNILGLEYTKTLLKYNLPIKPITIKRIGAGYNETNSENVFNSASGIRKILENKGNIEDYIPKNTHEIMKNSVKYSVEKLYPFIKYAVLSNGIDYLREVNDIREGLENRIMSAAKASNNYNEMLEMIKTKRYTMSNIKRALISVLLKIDKQAVNGTPEYLRILGMNNTGKKILKEMKDRASLPIVVKTADFSSQQMDLDILATNIAAISIGDTIDKDYRTSPIILGE